MSEKLDAIILAAGKGTRMKSALPKVLHSIQGAPLVEQVIGQVRGFKLRKIVVVVGFGEQAVRKALEGIDPRIQFARQARQKGTGHAVSCAEPLLRAKNSDQVLILAGDAPFLRKKTLGDFIKAHQSSGSAAGILSARVSRPSGYGRILRGPDTNVSGIREELDATPEEREICEINSGAYLFNTQRLFEALEEVRASNQKKEYYLTDTIAILIQKGNKVSAHCLASEEEIYGINDRKDLAAASKILYLQKARELLEEGVTVISPEHTFIAHNVRVGCDTVIYPFVYVEKGVKIGALCRLGPFTYIREGSEIEDGAEIGSFVEVVRTRVGKGSKIKHLSYVGDTRVGTGVNIGAGSITANYDGRNKHKTIIEDGAFIGSNTVLIAPVRIGKRAKTGAGAVVLANRHIKSGEVVAGVPARSLGGGRSNEK